MKSTTPHIVVLVSVDKKFVPESNLDLAIKASESFWNLQKDSSQLKNESDVWELFEKFRMNIANSYRKDNVFVVPIGFSIGEDKKIVFSSGVFDYEHGSQLSEVWSMCKNSHDYIYIPKDINPEKMMRLQTDELQIAIGENLEHVIEDVFNADKVKEISKRLRKFTTDLSNLLGEYVFKEIGKEKESNLKTDPFYRLIIKDFFFNSKIA